MIVGRLVFSPSLECSLLARVVDEKPAMKGRILLYLYLMSRVAILVQANRMRALKVLGHLVAAALLFLF